MTKIVSKYDVSGDGEMVNEIADNVFVKAMYEAKEGNG